jgi:serine protease Do
MNSETGNFAQSVIVSSIITLIILVGTLFVFRETIREYLVSGMPENVSLSAQESVVLTSSDRVVEVIEIVNPAVVSVVVTKDVPVYERYYEQFDPWGFWGGFSVPRVRENGTEEREIGGGSGFVVSADGVIVTNRHVVSDETARYSIILKDGAIYDAEVLARDPQLDIAILKISDSLESPLPYLTFGDSERLRLGQAVIAIGNALAEFRNSVSVGVVSGLARSITASDGLGRSEQLDQVIQTDAAINPGNSGGPLLNLNGEVIGVNVAVSAGAENIGFALPAHLVQGVVESVQIHGRIVRPFLGVRYQTIDKRIAEANSLPVDYGVLIIRGEGPEDLAVIPGSPADKAGITENTIITSVSGQELRNKDLATVLRQYGVGDEIELEIIKQGETQVVKVVLTES